MNIAPPIRLAAARSAALAAVLLFAVGTGPARAQDPLADPKLLILSRVSREEAQWIALARVPRGSVQSAELEEEGGSLRWTFDLKTPGSRRLTEVGVDARTGKVIERRVESAREEAREEREEAREARQVRKK